MDTSSAPSLDNSSALAAKVCPAKPLNTSCLYVYRTPSLAISRSFEKEIYQNSNKGGYSYSDKSIHIIYPDKCANEESVLFANECRNFEKNHASECAGATQPAITSFAHSTQDSLRDKRVHSVVPNISSVSLPHSESPSRNPKSLSEAPENCANYAIDETTKNLPERQRAAMDTFISSPTGFNWDDLVRSMREDIYIETITIHEKNKLEQDNISETSSPSSTSMRSIDSSLSSRGSVRPKWKKNLKNGAGKKFGRRKEAKTDENYWRNKKKSKGKDRIERKVERVLTRKEKNIEECDTYVPCDNSWSKSTRTSFKAKIEGSLKEHGFSKVSDCDRRGHCASEEEHCPHRFGVNCSAFSPVSNPTFETIYSLARSGINTHRHRTVSTDKVSSKPILQSTRDKHIKVYSSNIFPSTDCSDSPLLLPDNSSGESKGEDCFYCQIRGQQYLSKCTDTQRSNFFIQTSLASAGPANFSTDEKKTKYDSSDPATKAMLEDLAAALRKAKSSKSQSFFYSKCLESHFNDGKSKECQNPFSFSDHLLVPIHLEEKHPDRDGHISPFTTCWDDNEDFSNNLIWDVNSINKTKEKNTASSLSPDAPAQGISVGDSNFCVNQRFPSFSDHTISVSTAESMSVSKSATTNTESDVLPPLLVLPTSLARSEKKTSFLAMLLHSCRKTKGQF